MFFAVVATSVARFIAIVRHLQYIASKAELRFRKLSCIVLSALNQILLLRKTTRKKRKKTEEKMRVCPIN